MIREELVRLFDSLGLRGCHVVVHASLPSLGTVEGGARTVCVALVEAVGDGGTVVMPAFTSTETLGDSAAGSAMAATSGTATGGTPAASAVGPRRPVAYHPDLPVSPEIGMIAEAFRHLPGVLRSNHPTHSFAAWGRLGRDVLSTQRDNNPLGPLKKLNVMQGQVLLLGTTLQAATVIHVAEERIGVPYLNRRTAVRLNTAGYAERVVIENVPGCSGAFVKLEERLDPAKVRTVALPNGSARKIPIRYLAGLATQLLESDPQAFVCDDPACESCTAKRATFKSPRFMVRDGGLRGE